MYNEVEMLAVHRDVNKDGEINAWTRCPPARVNLWKDHAVEQAGHRWGMVIDMNSCIGCARA